jgi:hypothetical protein
MAITWPGFALVLGSCPPSGLRAARLGRFLPKRELTWAFSGHSPRFSYSVAHPPTVSIEVDF